MRSKTAAETRFLGMYIFAMAIIIGLVAFAYTSVFDMADTLPITRICNVIVACAAGISVVYAYIAAEASSEKRLARIYARRDSVIVMAISTYFVIGSSMFGMAIDAFHHGETIIPMMSKPAAVAGGAIIVVSVIAMSVLAILDYATRLERAHITQRERSQLRHPTTLHDGCRGVVTESEVMEANLPSKAYYDDAVTSPEEIQNYIPLSQMGVARVTENHLQEVPVVDAKHRHEEKRVERSHQREMRLQTRKKQCRRLLAMARKKTSTLFERIGATIASAPALIWHEILPVGKSLAKALHAICGWVATMTPVALSSISRGCSCLFSRARNAMGNGTRSIAVTARRLGISAHDSAVVAWRHVTDATSDMARHIAGSLARPSEEDDGTTPHGDVPDGADSPLEALGETGESEAGNSVAPDGRSQEGDDQEASEAPDDGERRLVRDEASGMAPSAEGFLFDTDHGSGESDSDTLVQSEDAGASADEGAGCGDRSSLPLPATGAMHLPGAQGTPGGHPVEETVPPFLRPFVTTAGKAPEKKQ